MRSKDIPVSGCRESWERMRVEGGGVRRFCDSCQTHVHDLSAMDERRARAFLTATQGMDLCLAYDHDERGRIVFADHAAPREAPVVPISRLRRSQSPARPSIAAPAPAQLIQLAGAASVALMLGACTAHGDDLPVLQVTDDPEGQLEVISAPVVIPPELPEASPPPEPPEPPEAEPCDGPPPQKPPPIRDHVKGKRVGVRIKVDGDNPLGGL
ncbi:MAG: hypothetical protein KC457_03840 [Myxococcales bacterium]|nr:hypothetical protein [Myxococcales bacterium]